MHGWEPAESTVFEYDGDRLIRTTTTREPEWDAQEVGYLLASRAIEFEPKNSLGTPLSVAMDPKHQFDWIPPTAPTIDWQEKSAGDTKDGFYKQYPDASRNGHMWRPPTLKAD